MTKEQEDKIIAQAQDILERRLGVREDIKVNLQNLIYYGAYYQGAIDAAQKIYSALFAGGRNPKGEDWVYLDAERRLYSKDKRSMQLFLDGTPIHYRNGKKNKKGKLESIEAYFVEYKTVIQEVK